MKQKDQSYVRIRIKLEVLVRANKKIYQYPYDKESYKEHFVYFISLVI